MEKHKNGVTMVYRTPHGRVVCPSFLMEGAVGMPSSYTRFQNNAPSTRSNLLVSAIRRGQVSSISEHAPLFSLPKEGEDARLTGGTRSLDRRLLALNIAGSLKKRPSSERDTSSFRSAIA
jgi:hypothetical protein